MNKKKFTVIPFHEQAKIRAGDSCDNYCICYYKSTAACDKAAAVARHTEVVTVLECGGGGGGGDICWANIAMAY